jgi:hypothetical protein
MNNRKSSVGKDGKPNPPLKTFIITPDFEEDMTFLRDFYSTDAKIIRASVKLLRMVREGVAIVTRK